MRACSDEDKINKTSTAVKTETTINVVVPITTSPIHLIWYLIISTIVNGPYDQGKLYMKSTEQIIKEFKEIHNERYDYSEVVYTGSKKYVQIICNIHGVFQQIPNSHLRGRGCPTCANTVISKTKRLGIQQFITKSQKVHNDLYTYNNAMYVTNSTKLLITCKTHGDFLMAPADHLRGQNCQACADISRIENHKQDYIKRYKDVLCTLYVIYCFNDTESFYKVGITTQTINRRFKCQKSMPYMYEVIKQIAGPVEDIYNLEDKLKLTLTNNYQPRIPFGGSKTECFSNIEEIINILDI